MAQTWDIIRGASTVVATVHELEYHGEWMGDCYVTVSVKSATPVEFMIGDHLTYRGDLYEINYNPNFIKKARSGSYGEGFTYDSIKLYSVASRLKDVGFKDVVLNSVYDQANQLVYSSQGKFAFFAGSVEDLADRIQANINRYNATVAGTSWKVLTPSKARSVQRTSVTEATWLLYFESTPASMGKTDLNITVEDVSCYDALKMAYSEFELSFYISGNYIIIGGKPVSADYEFEYGKGHGLYEIEQTTDDSQRIVTKLFAYGSEKNMPLNYYANIGKTMYLPGNRDSRTYEGTTTYGLSSDVPLYVIQPAVNINGVMTLKFGNLTVDAVLDKHTTAQGDFVWVAFVDDGNGSDLAFYNALGSSHQMVYVIAGANVNAWPATLISSEEVYQYPNALSINRLMLPGFPVKSLYAWVTTPVAQGGGGGTAIDASTGKASITLDGVTYTAYFSKDAFDPWVMSLNSDTIGMREGTANFDANEDEIFPTIEGSGFDEVLEAEQMEDNGYLSENGKFLFELKPATVGGSDGGIQWDYSDETVSISMKDGYCVGREFQVDSAKKDDDGQWVLSLKRQEDSSLGSRYFPYKEGENGMYQVSAGDKFVILGIPLPASFVDAAAKKLLTEALKHLATIDRQKFTYLPKIDDIEMARQHDLATASGGSILSVHDTICAGMQMQVTDDDLGIDYSPFIDNITIKENGNNGIPTYDVVLKDEKEMTTLERIQSEVRGGNDAIINGIDGIGDGKFLSRLYDDTAKGFITFLKGMQVGERFVPGLLGEGGVFRKESDGTTYLECDKMYVRMRAYFDTVEVREYRHSAGNRIASPAGMRCVRVRYIDANGDTVSSASDAVKFRCFFRAKDGENEIRNNFVVGDQAYCHITTVAGASDDIDSKGLNMRHYWRLIIGRSSSPDSEGYHWIDLSNATSETISGVAYSGYQADSDVPQEQDDIVQLGNVNDSTRRGAIVEFVTGGDSPSYQIFQGIGDIGTASTISAKQAAQYTTSGKNYVSLGYATGSSSLHSAGHAYLEVMGDFYFGDSAIANPSTYIRYNSTTKQLDIKANVKMTSPYTSQETDLEAFAAAVKANEDDLQSQIDGEIDTWFYEGTPTLSNAPAVDWNTVALKERHLSDLYYDVGTGQTAGFAYRFIKTTSGGVDTYSWQYIEDTAITEALRIASEAKDTADNKRRVFLTTPTPPYDAGDLWVNAVYPSNYTGDTDESQHKYNNDLLRCITAKAEGGTFSINDWQLASKYTDNSALLTFLDGYQGTLTQVQEQIDQKAETWYQDADPSTAWTTDDQKAEHVGDIWCDTSANGGKKTYIYQSRTSGATTTYYWSEQAVPDSVFDEIDGKTAIYTAWGVWDVPTGSPTKRILQVKDLFIPSSDTTQGNTAYKANKVYRCTAVGTFGSTSPTFQEVSYTDDTTVNAIISKYGEILGITPDATGVGEALGKLRKVLGSSTEISGGLVLTNIIYMKDTETTPSVRAGISGLYQSTETGTGYKGYGTAAWFGGGVYNGVPIDKEVSGTSGSYANYAKSLFRFDGSGYVAHGNLTWDKNGNVTIQGYSINATTLQSGGSNVATEAMLSNYVTLNSAQTITGLKTFNNKIKIGDVYLEWESANNALKVYKMSGSSVAAVNLYATGGVSAFGLSTSGGGVTLNQPLASINNLNANPSSSNMTLYWNGSSWGYTSIGSGSVGSIVVNGTSYSSVNGVVTLPDYPSDYVTLSTSQTITGLKTMTHGLIVSGRVYNSGDDEGIVVGMTGNVSALCLGSASGIRCAFYLHKIQSDVYRAFWRFNDGTTSSYDVYHPKKSGTIALTSDVPTNVSQLTNDAGYATGAMLSDYLPIAGGTMTGVINWGRGSSREILQFSTNPLWKSGLRYSWSDSTTVALWGQHKDTAFVWNAGTNEEINGHSSTVYDFRIRRETGVVVARLSNNIIWHEGNSNLATVDWACKALTTAGSATVGGTLGVTGTTTLSSTLTVNAVSVLQTSRPSANSTYNLGHSNYYWNYLYVNRIYLTNSVYLEYNSTNAGVRLVGAGFYSDSFVSAFGASASSGGITLNQPLASINNLNANPSSSNKTLVWNGSAWTYADLGSGSVGSIVVNGTSYSSVNGVVTLPDYPTTLDNIADGTTRKLANYLPLTGGTITGSIYCPLKIISTATSNSCSIQITNSNASKTAEFGYWSNHGAYIQNLNATNQTFIAIDDNGNVGIHTISPSYKLHVNGTLGVSGATQLNGGLWVTGKASASDYDDGLCIMNANERYSGVTVGRDASFFTEIYTDYDSSIVRWRFHESSTVTHTIAYPRKNGTIALTSDLDAYLPLTGGTLTGNLTVNGGVSSNGLLITGRMTSASDDDGLRIIIPNLTYVGITFGNKSESGDDTVKSEICVQTVEKTARWYLFKGTDTYSVEHPQKTGKLAVLTDLDAYLPLAGGTMTGTINCRGLVPTASNTYDLGSSSVGFRVLYTTYVNGMANKPLDLAAANGSGDIYITAEHLVGIATKSPSYKLHVAGTFYASGNSSIDGTLGVTGATTLSSTLSVGGNTTPSATGTYNLGSSSLYWNYTYTNRLYLASGVYFVKDSNGVRLVGAGFYSDSFVSAFGASSGGGSLTLNEPLASINSASLGAASVAGQTLVYNGSAWKYSDTSGVTLKADKLYANTGITIANGNLNISLGNISLPGYVHSYGNIITNSKIAIGYNDVSSSYQFYCKNNGYISGTLTQGSDIRRKNIIGDVDTLDIDAIAGSPFFKFQWRDSDDDRIYAGTSAQYWQLCLPETVLPTGDGYLSMDYGVTALISTIITARKVVDHEKRIAELEAENEILRKEINELKAA